MVRKNKCFIIKTQTGNFYYSHYLSKILIDWDIVNQQIQHSLYHHRRKNLYPTIADHHTFPRKLKRQQPRRAFLRAVGRLPLPSIPSSFLTSNPSRRENRALWDIPDPTLSALLEKEGEEELRRENIYIVPLFPHSLIKPIIGRQTLRPLHYHAANALSLPLSRNYFRRSGCTLDKPAPNFKEAD